MTTIADIPKFYTALAEWLSCLVFVLLLEKRQPRKWVTALELAASFGLLCVVQYFIGIVPIGLWLPGMGVALAIMYATILACCKVSPTDAGFFWAIAFIVAEFIASLDWQIYSFVAQEGYDSYLLQGIFLLLFYGGSLCVVFRMEQKRLGSGQKLEVTKREVTSAIVTSVGAFLISNISYVNTDNPFSGRMSAEIFYIRTLVDLAGVIMLVSLQDRVQELQTQKEKEAIDSLFQRQYEQYRQSRENIEMVNRKYHDLKHQIAIIRMEKDEDKREGYLRQMESELQRFGVEFETGSPVLDTILSSKETYCLQHDITLNVVADGKSLDFIDVMDLCSIFGNALDNAIESSEQVAEKEKRLIRLAVYTQNGFLLIRVENYFEAPLQVSGAEIQTTKQDKNLHGYGIKSIRHTAEKYGGSVSISARDGWFSLKVLIPLPEGK
ncbi:MAG: GHKL domain-containing protein [Clostridiales bacterium]|nr:GHKL domain-containing protein [Clostridiales bacterium]